MLEAILGLPLSAQELMWALTGCPTWSGSIAGQRFGNTFMKVLVGDTLPVEFSLHRKDVRSPWVLLAMSRNVAGRTIGWRAEFDSRVRGLIRTIRIISQEWNGVMGRSFDIRVSLSHIQVGPTNGFEMFSPLVPPSAVSFSLETFRQQRPRPALPLVSDAPPLR